MNLIIQCCLLVTLASQAYARISSSCCDAYLMDTNGQAIIDTIKPLTYYTKKVEAIELKVCSKDPVQVQVWTQQNSENIIDWTLVWQSDLLQLSSSETARGVVFPLKTDDYDNSFTLKPEMRLGLVSPTTGADKKIPLPYEFVEDLQEVGLLLSVNNLSDGPFSVGKAYAFDSLRWPRSFTSSINFCTEAGCPSGTEDVGEKIVVVGPKGPPGPPGPPGFDVGNGLFCDDPDYISGKVDDLNGKTNNIEEIITRIDDAVKNLAQSKDATGTCPIGFISGEHGLGFCYKFVSDIKYSWGNAHMDCLESYQTSDNKQLSSLSDIQSERENNFLVSQILTKIRSENLPEATHWTSGMYSTVPRRWVWFNEYTSEKKYFTYTNWAENEPKQATPINNCLALKVFTNGTYGWYSEECPRRHGYICKTDKKCF